MHKELNHEICCCLRSSHCRGRCYEIYGTDKAGKKVEIYFDPVSGKPVEQK